MKELLEIKEFLQKRIESQNKVKNSCMDIHDDFERGVNTGLLMAYENIIVFIDNKVKAN